MAHKQTDRYGEGIAMRALDATHVANAVRNIHPDGSGTDRIARRLKTAIESRQAGFHNGRPITLLLATGLLNEPELIAEAVAEAVIGRDLDGAPLIEIQAEHYIGEGDLLEPLLGPTQQGAAPALLDEQRLFSPYVFNTKGRELFPLRQITTRIQGNIMPVLQAQLGQAQQSGDRTTFEKIQTEKIPAVAAVFQEVLVRIEEIHAETRPPLAVILISGLEHLVAANGSRDARAFRQLLMRMCAGYADTRNGERTTLQDCIIIGSLQSADLDSWSEKTSQDAFQELIAHLNDSATGRELLRAFGGERSVVMLDAPTEASQRLRLEAKIEALETDLQEHFNVSIVWHEDVRNAVLERVQDPDRQGRFPNSRLNARFEELILGSIAKLINAGLLYSGGQIGFTLQNGEPFAVVDATDPAPPDTDPISPDALRSIFSRETPTTFESSEEARAYLQRLGEILEDEPPGEEPVSPGQYL